MRLALLALALALAVAAPGELDVFGHPVAPQVAGRNVLELFSNQQTREPMGAAGDRLNVALHDVPYVTLVRVDLRGVPGFLGFVAHHEMREAYDENVRRTRALYKKAGLPPPATSGHSLVIVADDDGVATAAVGLSKGFAEGLAIVVAPDGHEVARARLPSGVEAIEKAMRSLKK